ncbi:MAG: NAD(P)-dependent oxidoreductase [Phycisphaeraceae bacterium]
MSEPTATIIVTGSSGLIGRGVVQRLARQHRVVGFDVVPPDKPLPANATFITCDLTDQGSVDHALAQAAAQHGRAFASVVHLAAYVDFSGDPSEKYEQVTVRGTERLLTALANFDVEQFIFSSTMLVHASTEPGRPINEDSPVEPTWAYPESKVKTERIIHEKRGSIPAVILRIAGVYDDDCHSLPLAHQIQRIYEKQLTSQVFPGDLTHGQSLVHEDDLLEAFRLTIEHRKQLPETLTLLIGEPEPVSYDELQRTFSKLIHGEAWTTRRIPKPLAKAGAWVQDKLPGQEEAFIKPWMIDRADDHYELDISRAQQMIGWEPKHTLRDALPKMIESLKADPVRWYQEHKLPLPPALQQQAKRAG